VTRLVLDGSVWYVVAMLVAAALTAVRQLDTARALSRFYGCAIGVMGLGHLAAITYLGSERWFLYAIGAVVAIPAWALAIAAGRATERQLQRMNVVVGALMIPPLATVALAVPAVLNVLYARKPRRGFVIASAVVYGVMLAIAVVLIAL
jgi:hypothetical protein